jgi:carbon-monoxide dehydrogenase medium subunit
VKPVAFDYARPRDLDETVRLLREAQGFAKLIAGGQSLGPMLNLRLAQPDLLIDVAGLPDLLEVREHDDRLEIGAGVTHADIEDGRVADITQGVLTTVARGIAYRAVRNRGTLGGSLAHADPAADWLAALPLLDAEVGARGPAGERRIGAGGLITGAFTTVLEPDEIIRTVVVPRCGSGTRFGYRRFSRKEGEFAHALGAVLHDPTRNVCRAVIAAIDGPPIVVEDAWPLFDGGDGPLDEAAVFRLLDERSIGDAYDRRLHLTMLKRAAADAGLQGARAA